MKKITITLFTLTLLLFLGISANAQSDVGVSKVGTTAAQFLKFGAGARAISMGGAYTAVSDDIYASYYNPAGVALVNGSGEVAFNHAEWLADITYDYAAGSINLEGLGSMFITLSTMQVPKEKVRTNDFPEGDGRYWDATSLSIGLGFSRRLTDRFSIGLQAKFIQESIWNTSATGFALDIGTYYVTPFNDLVIGASVTNFGSKMQLDGRDIQVNLDPNDDPDTGPNNVPGQYKMDNHELPLTFRVGLSMKVLETRYMSVKCALDAVHPNDNDEYINAGTEFGFMDMFFLRGGFQKILWDAENGENGLTFGAGISYQMDSGMNIKFNYAYADYGDLEEIHFLDIALGF
ncbi:MAG: PorV/PorQ family protein [Melioribacteraceae bacterium]|nr:PorV/PorQ family protein [Melioribacteraceae bacterium]